MAQSFYSKDLLKNKVAFVTGGSSTGINFVIARNFGLHGAKLALLGRRKAQLALRVKELSNIGIESIGIQCDVRKQDQLEHAVSATVEKFGRIDVLLNGAAGNFLCSTEDLSANAFRTVFEIDTMGTFLATKVCINELAKTKGCILNISSTLQYPQMPYIMHAAVAKAGVDAMTRHFGVELAQKFGIRVNGIAPGAIRGTEGMSRLSGNMNEDTAEQLLPIPLSRLGTSQDCANMALFLCSEASSWLTGETILLDGGSHLVVQSPINEDMYQAYKAMTRGKL